MPRARNRFPRFLMDSAVPASVSALSEFYREEFLKHHRCLQEQREYFSAQLGRRGAGGHDGLAVGQMNDRSN